MTQDSTPEHQQDAGEEEWQKAWTKEFVMGQRLYEVWGEGRLIAQRLYEPDADQILADHAAARCARKLEERVREMEAALEPVALFLEGKVQLPTSEFWEHHMTLAARVRALIPSKKCAVMCEAAQHGGECACSALLSPATGKEAKP